MVYVQRQGVVHRDLAARNVLLTADSIAKVADFGSSPSYSMQGRSIANGGRVRVVRGGPRARGHARALDAARVRAGRPLQVHVQVCPSCVRRRSSATDVWGYGVLLWEMSTNAAKPPFDQLTNAQVSQKYQRGEMMEMGDACTPLIKVVTSSCHSFIQRLASECWHLEATKRVTFADMVPRLAGDLPSKVTPDPPSDKQRTQVCAVGHSLQSPLQTPSDKPRVN